jgi:hypothetical protein
MKLEPATGKAFATGSVEEQDNPEDRQQAIKQIHNRVGDKS